MSDQQTSPTIYQVLNSLDISYQKLTHEAFFTTKESKEFDLGEGIAKTKNLFLRNKKKTSYYLVMMESSEKIDLKILSKQLEEKKLSFASENDLMKYLKVTSGSVSPFTLINNKEKNVTAVIDENLLKYERVGFHPNLNTATLVLCADDFKKYLAWTKNTVIFSKVN